MELKLKAGSCRVPIIATGKSRVIYTISAQEQTKSKSYTNPKTSCQLPVARYAAVHSPNPSPRRWLSAPRCDMQRGPPTRGANIEANTPPSKPPSRLQQLPAAIPVHRRAAAPSSASESGSHSPLAWQQRGFLSAGFLAFQASATSMSAARVHPLPARGGRGFEVKGARPWP